MLKNDIITCDVIGLDVYERVQYPKNEFTESAENVWNDVIDFDESAEI